MLLLPVEFVITSALPAGQLDRQSIFPPRPSPPLRRRLATKRPPLVHALSTLPKYRTTEIRLLPSNWPPELLASFQSSSGPGAFPFDCRDHPHRPGRTLLDLHRPVWAHAVSRRETIGANNSFPQQEANTCGEKQSEISRNVCTPTSGRGFAQKREDQRPGSGKPNVWLW